MKDRKLTMNVGIISFMIVFVILCLVTFAILSLVSANSNLNTTNKSVEHTTEYYAISSKGEKFLEKIDMSLYEIYQDTSTENEYYGLLESLKEKIPNINISNHFIQYDLVDNHLKLHIEIEVIYPGKALYELKVWKIQPEQEWNPEQGIEIL